MQTYKIYCGGIFKETDEKLEVRSSFSNEIIAETFLANTDDLNFAVEKAKSVERELKNMPSYKKYEILTDIAAKIKLNRDHLAKVLALEASKPLKYALGEIDRAYYTFVAAAEEAKRLPKEYISIDWTAAGDNKEGLVKYFPIGLVAGIAPFNFPLNLAVHKIAPAIAAGNPIILKPARSTPLSTLELAKIIDTTALPKGAISILPMDRESGNQLVTDERFKLLSFTGSPSVGWKMKQNAGKKKVVLELGGNAGVIVSQTADINKSVDKCLFGGFAYAGQVCIHVQRIYVHASVFNQFTDVFVQKIEKLKFGEALNPETDICTMIDLENAVRVENWVNEAVKNNARVLCGGFRKEAFYAPTLLTNTTLNMKVNCEEVFGPVVTIEKYDDFEKAVELINNSEFGLQAGVFTNSISEMNMAFNDIECGGVIINDVPTFRTDHMPYGGIKNSGFGREGVKYAIAEMMEMKLLVKNIL